MKGMPFSSVQGKGVLDWKKQQQQQQQGEVVGVEPRSVLDNRRSPSPSSSSFGGGGAGSSDTAGVAAISDKWPPPPPPSAAADQQQRREEWASELQPIIPNSSLEMPASAVGDKCIGVGVDDWEAMLSDPVASPGQDHTFLRWIMGDVEDSNSSKTQLQQQMFFQAQPGFDGINSSLCYGGLADLGFGLQGAATSSVSAPSMSPVLLPPVPNSLPMFFQEPVEEKPHLFIQQNQAFFHPLPPPSEHNMIIPHPLVKRQQSIQIPSETSQKIQYAQNTFPFQQNTTPVPYQLQQRSGKPKDEAAAAAAQQQQQALVDQLFKAAELVENGNSLSAHEILARLNHQLPSSPFGMKPLLRSAFYFKEALHLLSNGTTSRERIPAPISNPWDVMLKLSAYKAFSEVSPLLHFANFTCTQALLEELADADRIHIVDFDLGVGGHWSSFMQELAHRRSPAIPVLKITAFVLPSLFHPLELHLTRQNLSHFAADLNIPLELNILSIESFDPGELLAAAAPSEAIGVNLPVGCHYNVPFPALLRLVKQLDPKVVVSVERGCDRSDLSFTHSFLHSFQSCMVLLDSIDAAGTGADVAGKIERFMVQPWVEGAVMGRHRAFEKLHPWRTLFNSVGFQPVQFSNFAENQAECLLKKVQVRGFHVEKRQASLILYWQRGELGSVSAWRC